MQTYDDVNADVCKHPCTPSFIKQTNVLAPTPSGIDSDRQDDCVGHFRPWRLPVVGVELARRLGGHCFDCGNCGTQDQVLPSTAARALASAAPIV